MLKQLLASSAALALCTVPLKAQGMHPPAGDSVTITGTVIDTYCNTVMGAAGAAHRACAEACAKSGEALAILGSDGTVYLPVSAKPADPQNGRLLPFAEGKVKVTGTHRLNHGLHTIEIKTIEAAT
jgi:hypothetical protein